MKSKINYFLKEKIWLLRDHNLDHKQLLMIKTLRIVLLSMQGFVKDLCTLRASALTLYTLLSIVPVIALLFGIAKGFGFEQMLKQRLLEQSADQDTMMLQLISFSENMLANTKGGVVAGIGIIILFWTVIKVIGNIEESFNYIWRIEKNRTVSRKISDYLSMMLLAPLLLILSSSITVFVKTQLTGFMQEIHVPDIGTRAVLYGLSFSPLLIMSLLFSFIFIFMPNRKIDVKAGLVAGIATGILFQWMQSIYLTLQIGASSYNAIYGSFAALPLFLIWLQIVWCIVLFGCELSFYIQNYVSYCHNEKFSNISLSLRKAIALQIMHLLVTSFARGEKPRNTENISRQLHLPLPVVQKSLKSLLDCQLIVRLDVEENQNERYQPAFDINVLTVSTVINALEFSGENSFPEFNHLEPFLSRIQKWMSLLDQCECNQLLKEIS